MSAFELIKSALNPAASMKIHGSDKNWVADIYADDGSYISSISSSFSFTPTKANIISTSVTGFRDCLLRYYEVATGTELFGLPRAQYGHEIDLNLKQKVVFV